jgi:hypothetical protein
MEDPQEDQVRQAARGRPGLGGSQHRRLRRDFLRPSRQLLARNRPGCRYWQGQGRQRPQEGKHLWLKKEVPVEKGYGRKELYC